MSTGVGFGGMGTMLTSVAIDPPNASIEVINGTPVTQQFQLVGHYSDGSMKPLAGASWTAGEPAVGGIDGSGLYTALGATGGVVPITADYSGTKATAQLTVKIHLTQNPVNAPPNVMTSLTGANTPDAGVVWAYPYNGTVWPRGLNAPKMMWNGGGAADVYYVHLKSATFELEAFVNATNAPTSRYALSESTWASFVDSTSGDSSLTVARWDGQAATVVTNQSWKVAPQSMRGTIYYWSNNLGRVLRIKPGAAAPDDFANHAPLNDPNQYVQSSCLMTCHTVSADGSTLVSGGGTFGGSYDLKNDKAMVSLGGTWGGPNGSASSVIRWMMPAVSPNGKYMLTNAMAEGLSEANDGTGGFLGLYTAADGQPVPNSGVQGASLTQPAWSPNGKVVAYLDAGPWSSWPSWIQPAPGDLKVYQFDEAQNPMLFNQQTVVPTGPDPNQRIAWPTITPDGKWVLYSRTPSADTRGGNGDLYIASTSVANQEARLSQLNGDGYPFAAGGRDLSWNFEPSFAPVAAGGYFWVVFTSRRTYGNLLTGDKTVVKQLWVAAIDQAPAPGVDPSHPAFHLTGQDESNLAMRGYWALDPCKGDGQGCMSGTDCCGGFCTNNADAGGPVCTSMTGGCSQDGDKCMGDSDCCGAAQGTLCINSVCSQPPPK
jgi:hypothetical protein